MIQPLSQLYRGPNRILSRQDKFFSLEIGSKRDTVFIDCLKPVLGPVLCPQQRSQNGGVNGAPVEAPGGVVAGGRKGMS